MSLTQRPFVYSFAFDMYWSLFAKFQTSLHSDICRWRPGLSQLCLFFRKHMLAPPCSVNGTTCMMRPTPTCCWFGKTLPQRARRGFKIGRYEDIIRDQGIYQSVPWDVGNSHRTQKAPASLSALYFERLQSCGSIDLSLMS